MHNFSDVALNTVTRSNDAEATDRFTDDERSALAPFFTNLDGPVFALRNLPETVKGALFARYSRSAKSLRRLFLDEFLDKVEPEYRGSEIGSKRAEALYDRVFNEYGDDSVAQLGGAHLACEGASNILTKVLERGRLMAYLEQSTRYVAYTDRVGDHWRYRVPAELDGSRVRGHYVKCLDNAFETYTRWLDPVSDYLTTKFPKAPTDSDLVYRRTIRAKALDVLRGMLPAATQSNLGIYGSGQAYESLLLRMRAHPLHEIRRYADLMLVELRKVIPAFFKRVDQPNRGLLWSRYFAETQNAMLDLAEKFLAESKPEPRPEVVLTDFDPDGEVKVAAAALYEVSNLPDDQIQARVRGMTRDELLAVVRAYIGTRGNRRHKPGRAFERTAYRFDVLTDYGAFRDLQRHRLLTLESQPLTALYGYSTPEAIIEAGAVEDWRRVMEESAVLSEELYKVGLPGVAPYAIAMAYKVRFYMEMNAREAMHIIELRTSPQGHPSYRRVCQMMHRLIAEQAGHRVIADAMIFADHSEAESGRLQAERSSEERLQNLKTDQATR